MLDRTSSVARSRVDQVGSLLRPQKLKDAYARHGRGEASDDELSRVQDESVRELISKQEARGLSIFTDGEFRRLNFQDSFVESVSGFIPKKQTIEFQESRTAGGEALQRWQPDSAKTDPALQYWRPIAEATRYYPAKHVLSTDEGAQRRYVTVAARHPDPGKISPGACPELCRRGRNDNFSSLRAFAPLRENLYSELPGSPNQIDTRGPLCYSKDYAEIFLRSRL